jgi:hypothetical protein
MATKKASAEFSFDNVQVQAVAELPKGTRDTAPNPLQATVDGAVDAGPMALPVPNGERAAEAERLIRRAVAGKYSLNIRFTDANDKAMSPPVAKESAEEVWVYFNVKSERKTREPQQRKYTAADIRKWANLPEDAKLTKEIRNAYRAEHGLPVR